MKLVLTFFSTPGPKHHKQITHENTDEKKFYWKKTEKELEIFRLASLGIFFDPGNLSFYTKPVFLYPKKALFWTKDTPR